MGIGKKPLYMAAAAALLAAVAACGSGEGTGAKTQDGAAKAPRTSISAVLTALNSDYWHMVESGIKKGGKAFDADVSITATTSESDVTGQISMIEDQITAGAHALIIAPADTKAILPVLRKARDKNIKVVLIDMDLDPQNRSLRASFIGTSEYQAGQEVGKYVVEHFKPTEIAIIRGLAGIPAHDARANGMRDVVVRSGFAVVTEQPADSERGKAVNVAENILESSPNVKLIYATNDEMALGAYQAVEGKKRRNDVFVIGFDGSPDAVKSIKDGKLGATLAQQPVQMGYLAVEALTRIAAGAPVESEINTPTKMVDKANVGEFEKELAAQ